MNASRALTLLRYDPDTGVLYRRIRTAQRHRAGDRADVVVTGGNLRGYRVVAVDSQKFLAHRLAWLMTYGAWPSGDIDHRNGDKGDNRIANLRDVVRRVNLENRRKPRADNVSGYLGVHAHQGRWRARIQVRGKGVHVGMFDDPESAHRAYVAAKRALHEGCTL